MPTAMSGSMQVTKDSSGCRTHSSGATVNRAAATMRAYYGKHGSKSALRQPHLRGCARSARPEPHILRHVCRAKDDNTELEVADVRPNGTTAGSSSSSGPAPLIIPAFTLPTTMPALPFPPNEVFLPGHTKTLHLYELCYLKLLDEVLQREDRMFAHVVAEMLPSSSPRTVGSFTHPDGGFTLSLPVLTKVVAVQRREFGAVVTIRGEARLRVRALEQSQPYMRALVEPLRDNAPVDPGMARLRAAHLRGIVKDILDLSARLPMPEAERRGAMRLALEWVDLQPHQQLSSGGAEGLEAAARLSFAVLQEWPLASSSERHALLRAKLLALEGTDSLTRLEEVAQLLQQARGMLAAKCALMSVKFHDE